MKLGVIVDNEFDTDIRVNKSVKIAQSCGLDIAILCYDYGKKEHFPHLFFVERIRINPSLKNVLFALFNRLPIYEYLWEYRIRKFILNNEIDVLHVHDLHLSKAAHKAVKKSGKDIQILLDLHENFPHAINSYNWTKNRFKSFIAKPNSWFQKESEYLSYADKLIVLSTHFKKTLIKKFPFLVADNIVTHPNIIDISLFDSFEKKALEGKRYSLFYFGGVAERRGIFSVFQAMKSLLAKGHQPTLLIVGPVDKADLFKFNEWLKELSTHVHHIPWIPLSDLLTYMNNCDICLAPFIKNPQHDSGVANKIFQYMYGKKPIIASNCTPQQVLIEEANCGIVYHNQVELEDSIVKLINSKEKDILGENGYRALLKKVEEDTKLQSLYSSLLQSH